MPYFANNQKKAKLLQAKFSDNGLESHKICFAISTLEEHKKNQNKIFTCNINREICDEKVEEITKKCCNEDTDYLLNYGPVILGVIGRTEKYYIIDGQHRSKAALILYDKNNRKWGDIRIQYKIHKCKDTYELEKIFQIYNINSDITPFLKIDFAERQVLYEKIRGFKDEFKERKIHDDCKVIASSFSAKRNTTMTNTYHLDEFCNDLYYHLNKNENNWPSDLNILNELFRINMLAIEIYQKECEIDSNWKNYVISLKSDKLKIEKSQFYLSLKNLKWLHCINNSKEKPRFMLLDIKSGKKKIQWSLKESVWKRDFGEEENGQCTCGKTIFLRDHQCGHIVSEKMGGPIEKYNLKPICKSCNKNMGTRNMFEYYFTTSDPEDRNILQLKNYKEDEVTKLCNLMKKVKDQKYADILKDGIKANEVILDAQFLLLILTIE